MQLPETFKFDNKVELLTKVVLPETFKFDNNVELLSMQLPETFKFEVNDT